MIGIIGAMDSEISLLVASMTNIEEEVYGNNVFHKGLIADKEVVVVKSSVGKVNAAMVATILLLTYKVDLVISTGIAGGIKPLQTKDVILVKNYQYGDVDVRPFGYDFGQIPGEVTVYESEIDDIAEILNRYNQEFKIGSVLTSDKFITSLEDVKVNLPNMCTEMESTAIMHVCQKFKKRLVTLRFISDVIGEPSQIAFYSEFEEEMAQCSAKVTLELVKCL